VDSYRIQYSYFADRGGPEYKAPWNQIYNNTRVNTAEDKAVQTPNSDTPYSYIGADLRAEPLVLTLPQVEKGRYYSVQFIDAYTFNFAYLGSRTSGNRAGKFLLAGPNWKGKRPKDIKEVIRSETEFAFVLYRTQLFNPNDIENVKNIQAGYKVQTLSMFLGDSASSSPSTINFFRPISAEEERKSPRFFEELNFVLSFCPTHPSETDLMARFAKLGIGPGGNFAFDAGTLTPDLGRAIVSGMRDAWGVYSATKKLGSQGKLNSGDIFGTREHLNDNYAYRMQAAVDGIYGNSQEEAYYVGYLVDSEGEPLDGTANYSLHFPPGQLPPANAFWSLTLYELPSHLLSPNPIDRYLINSPMLPRLKRGVDGGLTIYIQHESPGQAKESNWLPSPEGAFLVVLRLYWPEADALNGRWKAPPLQRAEVEELRIAS
jgi:Uncharacterized conserved protein